MKQKDSTKSTEKKLKKKESRRSKAKYPALDRKYNLKMRQDYIEPDYVNGVKNADGELVMRPLNDEEKDFLNKFYEETVIANFIHDDELKELSKELKKLKNKLKDEENSSEKDLERLDYLNMLYFSAADEALLYPDHEDQKKIYGENNSRNRCLFNRARSAGILHEINNETYDGEKEVDFKDMETGENLIASNLKKK